MEVTTPNWYVCGRRQSSGLLEILLNCVERTTTHRHLDALGGPATPLDLHEATSAASPTVTGHHIRDAIETCDVKAKLESMQS
jgi:hypothetical protein